jgi:EAL domain-containing protein (putative c-di-GMP-specific phosphodiesterase class I)
VRFSSPMLTRSSRELDLETDLRRALQEDRLTVVYQPIIELASGSMVAVEALGRWTHPIHGPLAPTEFIQIAERIGLTADLTRWMLTQACQALARWRVDTSCPGLGITVNISPASLRELGVSLAIDDFGSGLLSLAKLAQLPVASLKLDRTFATAAADSNNTAPLVTATIAIATSVAALAR